MDKQRIEACGNLILSLLSCDSGEEQKILHANSLLIDEDLVEMMQLVASNMVDLGETNANWLPNFAAELSEAIATCTQLHERALELDNCGEYAQGVIVAEQVLELALQIWGENHPNVATSLNNLAELYESQGRFSEAEPLYIEALGTRKRLFGEEHPSIANSLNNLANLYKSQRRFNEAEPLYLEALVMKKRLFGEEHPELIQIFNNLAKIYQYQARFSEAEPLYLEALVMTKRLFGEEHPDVANVLNNLAGLYKCQGRFREAEPLYIEVLAKIKSIFIEKNSQVAITLNNLAEIYKFQARFSEAEPLYLEALVMSKRFFGEENLHVADILNNLGGLYYSQGRFHEAEPVLLEALAMTKKFLGEDHRDVAITLSSLGELYRNIGRFNESEKALVEALSIKKSFFGEEHPDVAITFNNLAALYISQGRFSEAENLLIEALTITDFFLGKEHTSVAYNLNNLAEIYKYQGRLKVAETLYLLALMMTKRLFGETHPQVATVFNNLGDLYLYQRQFNEAESLLVEALAMTKHLFGEEHPDVSSSLSSLGGWYRSQGRYNEAEPLLLQALEMRKRLLGESHPDVATSLNNLAGLLAATNRSTEALALMHEATEIENGMISQIFAASSESDRLAYLETIRSSFDLFLSLVNSHLSNSLEAKQAAYDLVLKRKALTAAAFAAFNYALYSDRYSHLAPQFKQWQSLRAEQIHLIYSPPLPDPEITEDEFRTHQAEYQKRLSDLETESKNLEKLLASQVPEIQLQQQLETANRRAVALELPEGSTLVEFVRFDVYDFQAIPARGESQWKPAHYLAFILPAKQPDKVEMIDLGEAEHIDKLLRVFRSSISGKGLTSPPTPLLQGEGSSHTPHFPRREGGQGGLGFSDLLDMGDDDEETPTFMKYNPASGMELRKAIFDPISAVIGDSKNLLVSPDGELNLLPFQLLPDEMGTRYLMDEYTISYLSVGRDILRSHFQPTRPATAPLIIADPDFNLGNEASVSSEDFSPQSASALTTNQVLNTLAGNTLERAPGTRFLGEAVAKKLEVSPYLDAEALETQITKSQSPSILLIATHGVFLPDLPHQPPTLESRVFGNRFSATKVENPMLRSGLALAGANIWLSGGTLPEKAGKGFLFAQDVAALDLWANELTVLSACNTAIGDVKIGEGVFGLRRAFAVAGTKTLVMSLWPVPDKATALLMERFFDNLKCGFGRSNALLEAQNYIRTITVRELRQTKLGCEVLEELLTQNDLSCQEEERPLEHPFYWGAWVCQGETTELKVKN